MIVRASERRPLRRKDTPVRRDEEDEVLRAARAMMANHGINAAQEAQRRANNLHGRGADGQAHRWQIISAAIKKIAAQE